MKLPAYPTPARYIRQAPNPFAGRRTREIQNRWRTPKLNALLPKPASELLPTV